MPAPRLIVLAGARDRPARDFAARHARAGVSLLVPRDLSRRGWRFRLGDPAAAMAVAGERRFCLGEAGGVLTRLPAVTEADLPHIAEDDRAYVAAEQTAFLLALLTCTKVRVANRPTPVGLCGPAWDDAKWRRVARERGLPAKGARMHATLDAVPPEAETCRAAVTVIGEVCIGAADDALAVASRTIARAAGTELLRVEFDTSGPTGTVLRACPLVDLNDPLVEAAVLRLFGVPGAGRRDERP